MNFEPNAGDAEFRAEVRAFIARKMPEVFPEGRPSWGFDRLNTQKWTQALNKNGWAVPSWPIEWGGAAWPPTWRSIFDDELTAAGCPATDSIGTSFVGPVLYTFGTDEQKKRYLPRIRNGEEFWCQGFSEASAGSDVMSLRTTAVRQQDHFVVNGQKLWTTNAHQADMMFALARIDAPGNRRQQGLSFLLIDMRSPGIRVNPIVSIDGLHRLNEVVLENVCTPLENLVGEQGKGWIYARFLLEKERSLVAQLPLARRLVGRFRETLARERCCGVPLLEATAYRLMLAQFEVELSALEFLELRLLHAREDDSRVQVLASMLKLRGTELRQRVSEALWDAYGDSSMEFSARTQRPGQDPGKSHWSAMNHLHQRSATILGGTSEIQRNIIAAVSLGL